MDKMSATQIRFDIMEIDAALDAAARGKAVHFKSAGEALERLALALGGKSYKSMVLLSEKLKHAALNGHQ